jgi:hypothetical protein
VRCEIVDRRSTISRWNTSGPVRRRRQVAAAMSRQAFRLERALPAIGNGAEQWLGGWHEGEAVREMAANRSELR